MNKELIVSSTYPNVCYEGVGFGWEQEALAKPSELFIVNLNRLLRESDMSPAELARKVGVGRSAVNGWQKGRTPPTLPNLERIADAFGVPIRQLLEDPTDPKTTGIDIDTALRVVVGHVKSLKPTDK